MLTDLLKTVEGFNQLKRQLSEATGKIQTLTDSILPLQNELSLTLKKNNELHLHLMSTKEEFDSKTSFWRASMTKLEEENADLNFYVKKLKDDISRHESSNVDLRTRLDGLMSKTYTNQKAIVDGSLGKNQVFELNKPLNGTNFAGFNKPDSVWANELRAADERNRRLQEEVENVRRGKGLAEDEVKRIQSMLENRNLEITRLTGMIGTDFKPEMITTKYRESVRNANLEQMNDRIDLLNKENVKLEMELGKARQGLNRFCDLEKENKFMVENLSELRNQNSGLMSKLMSLERLGKGLGNPEEVEELKSTIVDLQDKISHLESEKIALKSEHYKYETQESSRYQEKQVVTDALTKLTRERETLQSQLHEFEILLSETKHELSISKDRENFLQNQVSTLKSELQAIQQTYSRINKDHLSTTEESYQLRQRIAALESQKNIFTADLETTAFENERLNKLKKIVEDQLEDTKKELMSIKSEFTGINSQKQKLSVLLEAAQKEVGGLKDENSHLLKLREKDKQAIIEVEERERDLSNQLTAALHSNRVIQKEHQSISDELSSKLDEIRRVGQMRASYEQEITELRPIKVKYQQLIEESNNLKNSALNKESLHTRLQRQIDSLEDNLRIKEISLAEQSKLCLSYKEEINRLENEVDNMRDHAALLNSNVKQSEYLHSETSGLKQQINEYREKERELIRAAEGLKAELKRAAEAVKNMQKQLNRANEQRQGAEGEVERLKNLINDLQNKDLHGQNENVKIEEKLFQAELLAEELKRQVGLEQHHRYRAEDELTSVKSVLDNEKSNTNRLLEQNTQLKSLISNLEKMKEDLLKKISTLLNDKSLDDDQKGQLVGEISALRRELASKNTENSKLTEAIRSIDQERDYIQTLLDQKTEESHAVESTLANVQKDIVLLKDTINSLQNKDSTSYKRIEEKDFQVKKLGEKCKYQESELEEIRAAYSNQARQIQELNEHLMAITKENQYVNEQLMKVTNEKDNLKKFYEDKSKNERMSQQMVRSVEREKEDLLLTYRKACEENERLNQAVGTLTEEQRDTYLKLQACEQELVNAQTHISMQEHEMFNLQQEINTFERQISHLTFQLETSERKAQEVGEIKESFMREVASARQIALNVEASKDDLIRKISSTENEKLILESKIRSMQSEISAIKSQYEYEKQRCEELQIVLSKERETLFKTQKDLGKNEFNKGLDDDFVNSQLTSTRNQLMNLEMENLKLKEENGRTNHKLHKYEGKIKELEGQMNKTSAAHRYADDWDS